MKYKLPQCFMFERKLKISNTCTPPKTTCFKTPNRHLLFKWNNFKSVLQHHKWSFNYVFQDHNLMPLSHKCRKFSVTIVFQIPLDKTQSHFEKTTFTHYCTTDLSLKLLITFKKQLLKSIYKCVNLNYVLYNLNGPND